ncbi:MAG: hypothetical protein JRD89_01065 [Deltaproteobacteria bacterium]|nr:hypothetical protein [Deltaproteobacteria bacterium]
MIYVNNIEKGRKGEGCNDHDPGREVEHHATDHSEKEGFEDREEELAAAAVDDDVVLDEGDGE